MGSKGALISWLTGVMNKYQRIYGKHYLDQILIFAYIDLHIDYFVGAVCSNQSLK